MDFPFGHHHHHHHHRPEEDPNPNPSPYQPNPYPPPPNNPYGYQPPPPPAQPYYGEGPSPVQHVSHEYGRAEYSPPPPPPPAQPYYGGGPSPVQHVSDEYGRPEYPPPPPPAQPYYGGGPSPVQHVSHEYGRPECSPPPPQVQHVGHEVRAGGGYGHGYGCGYENQDPHRPGFFCPPPAHVEHVSHQNRLGELTRQPTVRIFCKAAENYSLSIREGKVVLVPENPRDEYQHWYKDLKYSTRVKDEESLPSFALVNKATGQAIKHAIGAHHPVRLVPYKPDYLDESVLWTESKDTGENFRCIRMVNNITLNFDAFHGDEDHGGVRDGTPVYLYEWFKGKNQRWKIVPY